MTPLFHIAFSLIAPTLAGTATVVALVAGATSLTALLSAAGGGFLLAIPVSYFACRALSK